MLKPLATVGLLCAFLFARPSIAEDQQSKSHTPNDPSSQTQQSVPPTHVIIDPSPATVHIKPEADEREKVPEEKPLPRFIRPEWVIVYITAFYVVISWLTLWAIKRQADAMDQQVAEARKSSADASLVATQTLEEMKLQRLQTVNAMNKQAYEISEQTNILGNSVAAAQKAAEAALAQVEAAKSTQRAQLRIEFADPGLEFIQELGGHQVIFTVILDGTTRGYILDDSIIAYIADRPRKTGVHRSMGLPRNVTPELSPYRGVTLLQTDEAFPKHERDNLKIGLALEGKVPIFVNGRIRYPDIFGDEWVLGIDRYWKPWSSFGVKGVAGGGWHPVGDGRHDTHQKVDTNYGDKLSKSS